MVGTSIIISIVEIVFIIQHGVSRLADFMRVQLFGKLVAEVLGDTLELFPIAHVYEICTRQANTRLVLTGVPSLLVGMESLNSMGAYYPF